MKDVEKVRKFVTIFLINLFNFILNRAQIVVTNKQSFLCKTH